MIPLMQTQVAPNFIKPLDFQHFPADAFPLVNPIHWLTSHFAVGGWSPLQRLSGMLTAHMTQIAPRNGFTWHPHRGLEIYTWVIEGELYHEDTTGGRGVIRKGEIQRMFAGEYIEHQELNLSDEYARVIQIWYVADFNYQGLPPHYQQVGRDELPIIQHGDATHYRLIGDNSPLEQHMQGRLSAGVLPSGGKTTIEAPRDDEDLFFYVTDGAGSWRYGGGEGTLGQYDVILSRPTMGTAELTAQGDAPLEYLAFYLPKFIG
jgi:redox-sensitive bicupin YhaK (pirin superfamily)